VGSKADLSDDREVPADEGKALARKWNCPGFETSAKTRMNVDEVFTELVRIVVKSKQSLSKDEPAPRQSGNCCVIL
jgi:GTPase SAR1 family protein